MSQNSAADTAHTGPETDQKHHDDKGIGSPTSSPDSIPSDAADLRDDHLPQATEPPRPVDPYQVDNADLRVEHEMLKAFINAPVDQARHVARYVRPGDFYSPVSAQIYAAAIEARRRNGGSQGIEDQVVDHASSGSTIGPETILAYQAVEKVLSEIESSRHRSLARNALVQVFYADGDPGDLRRHASTILHQAMRREAVMHATRVQQILAETAPEEIFPAIERSSVAMHESRLEERYRALNDFPPAEPPRRARDTQPEVAVAAERTSASHRVTAALGAAAGAATSSRRTRPATITSLESRRGPRTGASTATARTATDYGRG